MAIPQDNNKEDQVIEIVEVICFALDEEGIDVDEAFTMRLRDLVREFIQVDTSISLSR